MLRAPQRSSNEGRKDPAMPVKIALVAIGMLFPFNKLKGGYGVDTCFNINSVTLLFCVFVDSIYTFLSRAYVHA